MRTVAKQGVMGMGWDDAEQSMAREAALYWTVQINLHLHRSLRYSETEHWSTQFGVINTNWKQFPKVSSKGFSQPYLEIPRYQVGILPGTYNHAKYMVQHWTLPQHTQHTYYSLLNSLHNSFTPSSTKGNTRESWVFWNTRESQERMRGSEKQNQNKITWQKNQLSRSSIGFVV